MIATLTAPRRPDRSKAYQGETPPYGIANDDTPSQRREGTLSFGPLRIRYSCNDDGGELDIDSIKLTPTAKHRTMDEALMEAISAVLVGVGSSVAELVQENRNESQEAVV